MRCDCGDCVVCDDFEESKYSIIYLIIATLSIVGLAVYAVTY